MLIVVLERDCTGQAIFHSPNEGDAASNKQNWVNMGFTNTDLAIIMKEEYDQKPRFPYLALWTNPSSLATVLVVRLSKKMRMALRATLLLPFSI